MLILVTHPAGICWSGNHESGEVEFSIKTRNKPLHEILDQLGYITGYSIEIASKWEKIPVTISTGRVGFDDGLRAILLSAGIKNFALIRKDNEKKLTIFTVGNEDSNKVGESAAKISAGAGDQAQEGVFSQAENESNPPPPEILNADLDMGDITQDREKSIPAPPAKLLNELQGDKPESDDAITTAPPPEQLLDRYHGETISSSKTMIKPPSEKIIMRYQGEEFVGAENKKIPPPSIEILMRQKQ